MGLLKLEVLDYEGPTRWRWRLTQQPGGGFVADHQVDLDASKAEFEAFADLHAYLRWNAAPDRRLPSEAQLVAEVGEWIGSQVIGPVGPAILQQRPAMVQLALPEEAAVLAYRPLELAYVGGRPLALQNVSFVVQPAGAAENGPKTPVGERLRMLAVFSLPTDASALNLRRERYALARLVHTIAIANGRAVELRVLQYGVTRQRLGDVLLEVEGWDVLHISGHGLPAGLLLERDDGRRDLVSSTQLVELLEPAAGQIKLVTMSSCSSAAVTAAEHLQLLGITPATRGSQEPSEPTSEGAPGASAVPGGAQAVAGPLPAVAAELVRRLDCAVVAMRYPVVDDFAIALAGQLYDLVLGKGQPLARAVQLTLPRVVVDPPTPAVPPLSVATPALFGPRAVELKLQPPAGRPVVFDAALTKLAGFPPEPVRFVGRVGPMARANAALAPGSDHSAVLLHGMAGAGKTACALELAYGHEQAFGVLVWHKAPDEDHDITGALTNFALDLERKLKGLQFSHLVDDQAALEAFLPQLTEFLKRSRVLVVLDNLESLLTERGDWRDDRWGTVVEALVGHDGFSRVLLTSRRRPRVLDTRVLVEPVHALSLTEAVLLARELPNLRKLLDGTAEVEEAAGRALVARTLAVVQGHPKLIELADGQAADPTALEARLGEADQAWLAGGTRLEAFFEQGESTASDQDYLRVLENWTRGAASGLPEAAATLFHLLCCLEDDDRLGVVVSGNWADVWRRLERPGEPPDLEAALAPLVGHGLVAVDRDDDGKPAVYHLHPGVAATGRTEAGPDFQTAVDNELAAYWVTNFRMALEHESQELGWLVLQAGRSAAPYLIRLQAWNEVRSLLEQVIYRDTSTSTVAGLLPTLRHIVEATKGTDLEVASGRTLARALMEIRPAEAQALLRGLLKTAVAREEFLSASILATDLVNLARRASRYDDALTLAAQMQEYTSRAGMGPWTQLSDEGQRLQILLDQGKTQQVLDRVKELRPIMANLPEESDAQELVEPWKVREATIDLGRSAAQDLEQWEEALALNAEQLELQQRRDAPRLDVARVALSDCGPLISLRRFHEARDRLLACREVFEDEHAIGLLAMAVRGLADVEGGLGHRDGAIRLQRDALRLSYAAGQGPADIAGDHFNLANYLWEASREPSVALAHRLACSIIELQIGFGRLPRTLRALRQHLADFGQGAPLPRSFAELCALVEQTPGVRFGELVARLPRRAPDGDAALVEVLRLARELPSEEPSDPQRYFAWWDPVLAGIVAAIGGNPQATQVVERALTERGEQADWAPLAPVLRRILAGDRDPHLPQGLDPVDTAITQRALDALAGRVHLDPDSWQTLTSPTLPDQLAQLAAAVVAVARGDQDTAAALEPALTELAGDQDWAALAGVLRRILAGERDPVLTQGLDETDTAVVTAILEQLSSEPSTLQP